jgi:PilZ domain
METSSLNKSSGGILPDSRRDVRRYKSNPLTNTKSDSKTTRRFPRHALDVRVSVHAFRSGESVSFWGRSSELGEDGVGATLTGELEAGEVVSMELALPMAPFPIKFRALVRYRDGLRHGFEFLALSAAQRDEIRRICETLSAGT